ncbi:MAG TPA: WecB/TagA/CpsF family glycosyltransferase [Firmicutes bacterium]|nr:WecB/TagA/CpsF family glycosyltransferase [Bacillota bacterium]
MKRHDILGTPVDALTYEDAVELAGESIRQKKPLWILAVNPEKIMKALDDARLKAVLSAADVFIPDGVGILWAGKILGKRFQQRVTGVDLFLALTEEAARQNWRVYLLGAARGVAEEVARNLEQRFPGLVIAGVRDGYFTANEESAVAETIREARPDLLFVGMGSPRQEHFIRTYQDKMGVPLCMGVGGSFDVLSGKKKRAPRWLQQLGLEWCYRLVTEPARILRMGALPRFMLLVLRRKFGLLKLKGDKK